MLKNNLIQALKEEQYVHIRNQSNIAYAVITAMVALVAGFLFNKNAYLPMILNISLCFACFLLSLTMKDETKYDRVPEKLVEQSHAKMSTMIYIAILSYAFFYTAVTIGQANSKLFIQYQLNESFEKAIATIYFSQIILMSRIARILSNVLFDKLYQKLEDKINIVLCSNLLLAFMLIGMASCLAIPSLYKIGMMVIGFCIILAVRDPFKIYIQDLLLKISEPEEQQALFAHLELARKIGQTALGFVVSAALLKFSMMWIIFGIVVISWMALKSTFRLFGLVQKASKISQSVETKVA